MKAIDKKSISMFEDLSEEHGPFDIIGDIHGCFNELVRLMKMLGYVINEEGDNYKVSHLTGRKLIFVGDLVDRGPDTPKVLGIIMDMVESGTAYCVQGNHENKLRRALIGNNILIRDGLAESLEQIGKECEDFKKRIIEFLGKLKYYYIFDDKKLVVSHAGMREDLIGRDSDLVKAICLYGQEHTKSDMFGLPIRVNWAQEYKGKTFIVYGHTVVDESKIVNNTINIDTGCVFGRKLTAFRYPEMITVAVDSAYKY